jgi:hypothetical protein
VFFFFVFLGDQGKGAQQASAPVSSSSAQGYSEASGEIFYSGSR